MATWKFVASFALIWAALAGSARADAMTWANSIWGQSQVSVYQQGTGGGNNSWSLTSNSDGTAPAPSSPVAAPVSAPPVETPAPIAAQPAVAPAPIAAAVSPSTMPAAPVDAFINLGTGPYPEQSAITTGNPQPWYDSSQIVSLFGGQPTAQQQQSFSDAVIQRVEQTFRLSGVPITLTDNPNVPAAHTLSVVSNAASYAFPGAIGTTNLGSNGFSFIDAMAKSAQSVDQLEWIAAHNISHELMLAFGVGENYDKTGNFIDATNANWSMMVSPTATFSAAAAQALQTAIAANGVESTNQPSAQRIGPAPVPEPATVALWVSAIAVVIFRRARKPAVLSDCRPSGQT